MINRQSLRVIQQLLRSQQLRTRNNKTWDQVRNLWGIGRRAGNEFLITELERESLRIHCLRDTGYDPMTAELGGDRMAMAEQGANEKLSAKRVFTDLVQVAKAGEQLIHLRQGTATTPSATLLSIDINDLTIGERDVVVLVENGMVMREWARIVLPEMPSAPLFVYRGHGDNARMVRQWLRGLPKSVERLGYFDWDPAGITMGVEGRLLDGLLVPDLDAMSEEALRNLRKQIKWRSWVDQQRSLSKGGAIDLLARELLEEMLEGEWAITQEAMVEHVVPLRVFRFL